MSQLRYGSAHLSVADLPSPLSKQSSYQFVFHEGERLGWPNLRIWNLDLIIIRQWDREKSAFGHWALGCVEEELFITKGQLTHTYNVILEHSTQLDNIITVDKITIKHTMTMGNSRNLETFKDCRGEYYTTVEFFRPLFI